MHTICGEEKLTLLRKNLNAALNAEKIIQIDNANANDNHKCESRNSRAEQQMKQYAAQLFFYD